MNENKRQDLLARMRGVQKDVDRSRATRSQQSVSRSQPGFAELPEYKQVVMQKLVSEQLNMPNPFYRAHESASGATADIDGRAYDNFASYDYLGLNSDPRIRDAAMAAIDQFGISASANGSLPVSAPFMPSWKRPLPKITRPRTPSVSSAAISPMSRPSAA